MLGISGASAMKNAYCWRCKQVVPVLNEEDFTKIATLFDEAWQKANQLRLRNRELSLKQIEQEAYAPVIEAYKQLTGATGISPYEIIKHRALYYGAPCSVCGKNLRTPLASKCFECGHPVQSSPAQ